MHPVFEPIERQPQHFFEAQKLLQLIASYLLPGPMPSEPSRASDIGIQAQDYCSFLWVASIASRAGYLFFCERTKLPMIDDSGPSNTGNVKTLHALWAFVHTTWRIEKPLQFSTLNLYALERVDFSPLLTYGCNPREATAYLDVVEVPLKNLFLRGEFVGFLGLPYYEYYVRHKNYQKYRTIPAPSIADLAFGIQRYPGFMCLSFPSFVILTLLLVFFFKSQLDNCLLYSPISISELDQIRSICNDTFSFANHNSEPRPINTTCNVTVNFSDLNSELGQMNSTCNDTVGFIEPNKSLETPVYRGQVFYCDDLPDGYGNMSSLCSRVPFKPLGSSDRWEHLDNDIYYQIRGGSWHAGVAVMFIWLIMYQPSLLVSSFLGPRETQICCPLLFSALFGPLIGFVGVMNFIVNCLVCVIASPLVLVRKHQDPILREKSLEEKGYFNIKALTEFSGWLSNAHRQEQERVHVGPVNRR